jgi:hypothetical protein
VRLPSGRYKKVKVGDLVDGGKIVAIGESELRYQKGSRNLTLKMPRLRRSCPRPFGTPPEYFERKEA